MNCKHFIVSLLLIFLFFVPTKVQGNAVKYVAKSLPFKDCGSIYYLISIKVSNCKYPPCQLSVGHTVNVTAEFDGYARNYQTQVLKHKASWKLASINLRASVTPDECTGNWCPVRNSQGLFFTAQLTIDKNLPTARGSLEWRLLNEREVTVMCYQISIALTT